MQDPLAVTGSWGTCAMPCPPHCSADITDDCVVNVKDLLMVLNTWGARP
jgi:hypothetical protein